MDCVLITYPSRPRGYALSSGGCGTCCQLFMMVSRRSLQTLRQLLPQAVVDSPEMQHYVYTGSPCACSAIQMPCPGGTFSMSGVLMLD